MNYKTQGASVFTWGDSYSSQDPGCGAGLRLAELPCPSDKDMVLPRVFIGIFQRGHEGSSVDP